MPSEDDLFLEDWYYESSSTMRTLIEQHRFTVAMPDIGSFDWDDDFARPDPQNLPANTRVVTELDLDFIPEGQSHVKSDTGELTRDWEQGYSTIDAPRSKAAYGWIGGKRIELGEFVFEMNIDKMAVALTSLSDDSLEDASEVLISAVARAQSMPENIREELGLGFVFASEPISGSIELPSTKPVSVNALAGNGSVIETRKYTPDAAGKIKIELDPKVPTHWWQISR